MKLRFRLTSATLMLTLSAVGLAACGSDDSGDDAKASDTASQTDEATTDAPDDSTETDQSDDQGKDGKPSKQAVVDGYTKLVADQMGGTEAPGDIVKTVVTCFVDEVYDDASPKTLDALAESDPAGVDPADATLFTDATSTCQKEAIG